MASSKMYWEQLIGQSEAVSSSSAVVDAISRHNPFRISPNPSGNFESESWRRACRGMKDALLSGAPLVALTGAAGTGKTSLTLHLERQLSAWRTVVRARYPALSVEDFLYLLRDWVPAPNRSPEAAERAGMEHPAGPGPVAPEQASAPVFIIDDADLCDPALVRRLVDLAGRQTEMSRGLQLLLVGLPSLVNLVYAGEAWSQKAPPDVVRFSLAPLSPAEVEAYVKIRLQRSGLGDDRIFSNAALDRIAEVSNGIPRVVNLVCSYAVRAAAAEYESQVGVERLAEVLEALRLSTQIPNALPDGIWSAPDVGRAEDTLVEPEPPRAMTDRPVLAATVAGRRRLKPDSPIGANGPAGRQPPEVMKTPIASACWQAWLVAGGVACAVIAGGSVLLMPYLRGTVPPGVAKGEIATDTAETRGPAPISTVAEFGRFDGPRAGGAAPQDPIQEAAQP